MEQGPVMRERLPSKRRAKPGKREELGAKWS